MQKTNSVRPRIAWISPLADSIQLRSAAFTVRLMPVLRANFDVEFFVDDPDLETIVPGVQEFLGDSRYHYHRLHERNQASPFTAYVFQLENDLRCQFVRLCAQIYPGICYLHDLGFNRLFYGIYRYTTAPTELNGLVAAEFGVQVPSIGDYHVRKWSYEIFDRQYSCGRREVSQLLWPVVFRPEHVEKLARLHSSAVEPPPTERAEQINVSRRNSVRHEVRITRTDFPAITGSFPSFDKMPPRTTSGAPESTKKFNLRECQIVFTGEHYLSDRIWSFLSACSKILQQKPEQRIAWLLTSATAELEAKRRVEQFLSCFPGENLDGVRIVRLTEWAELGGMLHSENAPVIFVNLRTDPLGGWPLGMEDALAAGVIVVATEGQWGFKSRPDNVLLIPEGIGDDLILAKLVGAILDGEVKVATDENFTAIESKVQGVDSATRVVGQLVDLISTERELLQCRMAEAAKELTRAGSRLIELERRNAGFEVVGSEEIILKLLASVNSLKSREVSLTMPQRVRDSSENDR